MVHLGIPNHAQHCIFIRYRILHAFIFTAFMKLFEQIPLTGNTSRIDLTVQSQYNLTVENTSLYFVVCNYTAGGCESNRLTTTSESVNTEMPGGSNNEDRTIIIVVATLAGVIAVSVILVGVLCWKRKRNQRSEKRTGN